MDEVALECMSHELDRFTCRVCLQNGEVCNSFYDFVSCNSENKENKELRELFFAVTRIEIYDDDAKPTQICGACTDKLVSSFEFITIAEKNEEILNLYMMPIEEQPINRSHTPPKELEFTLDVEEDYVNETQMSDNEEELKDEDTEGIQTNDSVEVGDSKQCEDFEVLEFEFIMDKDTDNTVEITTGDTETTEKKNHLSKTKSSTAGNSIGSRLSTSSNSRTHRYNCSDCQRSFAKLQTYQRHIENAHTYAPREEIAAKQTKEPTIPCPKCPRYFRHNNDLQRHMLATHPDATADKHDEIGESSNKTKRKYNRGLCPHCGRDFPMASLKIHIRRHLGVNPYKCEECGKGFPRKQDLTVHQRQHSGERPHLCTVCGKSFIRPNKLARHMRIHLGIRPYKCDECGKCFSQSNDLKIHMRRHSGEKPYACGICAESFISGTALRVHRKAKSHFEPSSNEPDPFFNCRVNTRPPAYSNKS